MAVQKNVGVNLIKIASIYMVVGLMIGIGMAVSGDHTLFPVHAHINLLGWATMAITGIIYVVVPALDGNRLSRFHFWLHNLGLPIMMVSLAFHLYGRVGEDAEKVIGVGSVLVFIGLLMFMVNVFKNVRTT
jgi:cbb3-type cytochrome oxidase subunit 1